MIKPISFEETEKKFYEQIPDFIINAFNTLIVKNFNPVTKEVIVKQDDVVTMVCNSEGIARAKVFANHWLDIEKLYMAEGWKVTYRKPSIGEASFDAYFTFEKGK